MISDSYRTLSSFADLSSSQALYRISVRQTRCLPPTSFRFYLTIDTLVFGCNLPTIRAAWGLSPVRVCSCRRNTTEADPKGSASPDTNTNYGLKSQTGPALSSGRSFPHIDLFSICKDMPGIIVAKYIIYACHRFHIFKETSVVPVFRTAPLDFTQCRHSRQQHVFKM